MGAAKHAPSASSTAANKPAAKPAQSGPRFAKPTSASVQRSGAPAKAAAKPDADGVFQAINGDVFDHSQPQFTVLLQGLQGNEAGTAVKIMQSGQTYSPAIFLRLAHRVYQLNWACLGDVLPHQVDGLFKKNASWLAVFVPLNLAAGRIGRFATDVG